MSQVLEVLHPYIKSRNGIAEFAQTSGNYNKKYLIKSWKTNFAYTKTGRFYQKPLEAHSKMEAIKIAEYLINKHKVYVVEISIFDEKDNCYKRLETMCNF